VLTGRSAGSCGLRVGAVRLQSKRTVAAPEQDVALPAQPRRRHPCRNITGSVDVQGDQGAPVETQCYAYSPLDQLTQAWSASDNCAANPASAGNATVGGPQPYWTSWTVDSAGNRTGQTQHALPGSSSGDSVTTYTVNTPGHAHALTSTTTTGPGAGSSSYGYDADGNTTTRTLPSGGQSLTWTPEGRLDTVKDAANAVLSGYVYDADGSQLIRHDPAAHTTTLYLPGEELTYNTSTGVTNSIRYYTFNGTLIAQRTNSLNPTWVDADPHNTGQIAYDPTDQTLVSRRQFDPYGNPITASIGTWPAADTHTYLNKPTDTSTGLTDVGARNYDTTTGRFLSVDPILDPGDPQSLSGYAYADNNPIVHSDPTGLKLADCTPGGDCGPINGGTTAASHTPLPGQTGDKTTRHNKARDAAVTQIEKQADAMGVKGTIDRKFAVNGASKDCLYNRSTAPVGCGNGIPDIVFITTNGLYFVWEVKAVSVGDTATPEAEWYVDRMQKRGFHAVVGWAIGGPTPVGNGDLIVGPGGGAVIYGRPKAGTPQAKLASESPQASATAQPSPTASAAPSPGAASSPTPRAALPEAVPGMYAGTADVPGVGTVPLCNSGCGSGVGPLALLPLVLAGLGGPDEVAGGGAALTAVLTRAELALAG